jgi:dTDP-4-amino-4,6-dideoxygalactose transaminase
MADPVGSAGRLPVARPFLPAAARLLPYLEQIDRTRTYSNYGPLARQLEARLGAHFGLTADHVTTVASATAGLTAALWASGCRAGDLCVMPGWTFVASAHAAIAAGMVPYFIDVTEDDWAITPEQVVGALRGAPGRVGAVMPVVPFGTPLDLSPWDRFSEETGIPVVIDAAAAFDSLRPGRCPAVVSLHATKILGIGEGGFVISTDAALVQAILQRANFGFYGSREAKVTAINGKMSEYHAAVGNAALDDWADTRAHYMAIALDYVREIAPLGDYRLMPGYGQRWVSATCLVRVQEDDADAERRLAAHDIDTRRWWGDGCHRHAAFADYPRGALEMTERLARTVIGLPCYVGLTRSDIARVSRALGAAHART